MSTYLTPTQCAEQFDAYEKATKRIGLTPLDTAWHCGKANGYAHAAQFLREFAVLRWTKELPAKLGWYWYRLPSTPKSESIGRIVKMGNGSLRLEGEQRLEYCQGWEWAGPIPEPIEEKA